MGTTKNKKIILKSVDNCIDYPVTDGQVIHFTNGLPGFSGIKDYRFIIQDAVKPFMFLEAMVDDPNLSFVCVNSFAACQDYEVPLSNQVVEELKINSDSKTAVISLVTVGKSTEETTANLLGPIIINLDNGQALQAILEDSSYSVNYHIWQALVESQNKK